MTEGFYSLPPGSLLPRFSGGRQNLQWCTGNSPGRAILGETFRAWGFGANQGSSPKAGAHEEEVEG